MKRAVMIMCDQFRYDLLEGRLSGVHTPNIDRIRKRAVVFTQAYSQTPVCVPARYSFISGQSPFCLGLNDNRAITPEIRHPLPQLLKTTRCACLAVGKMHATPPRTHFGFDRLILTEELVGHIQDDDHLLYLREHGFGDVDEPNGKRSEMYYVPQRSVLPEKYHNSHFVGEKAAEFIRNNRNRPFFLYASFIKPHPPFDPVEEYARLYPLNTIPKPVRTEEEKNPKDRCIEIQNDYKVNGIESLSEEQELAIRQAYFGTVTQLDAGIGLILDELDKHGLTEDTLLIFASDHGEMLGDHYAYGKRCYYEESCKIPLLVCAPGERPRTEERFANHTDIYATIAAYMGAELPAECEGHVLLSDDKRQELFCEFGFGIDFKFMYRKGSRKLIWYADGGQVQLFDLSSDPHELHDIAAENRPFVEEVLKKAEEYYTKRGCSDAVEKGKLKIYPKTKVERHGFLDQRARWRWSILEER